MSAIRRIRWGWIVAAAFLAEVAILALFFLLLLGATLAGVPEIAQPMSTLDNVDAIVSSFVMFFLLTLWAAKRIESDFVLHGALIGLTGVLLFSVMWISTTDALAQPLPYVVAHGMKVLGGMRTRCGETKAAASGERRALIAPLALRRAKPLHSPRASARLAPRRRSRTPRTRLRRAPAPTDPPAQTRAARPAGAASSFR